jgi:hypothetical protein
MTLESACIDGREYREADLPARPLDFAVAAKDQTLLCFTGWWTLPDWGNWNGMAVAPFPLTPIVVSNERDAVEWSLSGGRSIALPSDGDAFDMLSTARLVTDLNRPRYLDALRRLVDYATEFDLNPWIEAVMARPVVDPVEYWQTRNTRLRKIGCLFLQNEDNKRIAVLLIDEHGAVARAGGSSFLEAIASQWIEADPRPSMEDFLTWAAGQRPYGLASLEPLKFISQEGFLEDLAIRALV